MVVIVDYGAGNLLSVQRAFQRAGAGAAISREPADLAAADRIVLPGVGSFAAAMGRMREGGLLPVLERRVRVEGVPVLGICLGMQMFTGRSEEGPGEGLGWLRGETVRLPSEAGGKPLKVPHLGWNDLAPRGNPPLLAGLSERPTFYFAHAYHAVCGDPEDVAATAEYGVSFAAVVRRDNVFGAQFHPEKSHANGVAFLRRFLELTARA